MKFSINQSINYLCVDVDSVVAEHPEAGLGPVLHGHHGHLKLGAWLGPGGQDGGPVGDHQVQGGAPSLVPEGCKEDMGEMVLSEWFCFAGGDLFFHIKEITETCRATSKYWHYS